MSAASDESDWGGAQSRVPIGPTGRVGARWMVGATLAVLVRPVLWATAIRQILSLAVPGWWHRPPFLPRPDPAYLAFRFRTAYGDAGAAPPPADVVTYLHWCRGWSHLRR